MKVVRPPQVESKLVHVTEMNCVYFMRSKREEEHSLLESSNQSDFILNLMHIDHIVTEQSGQRDSISFIFFF